MTDADLRYLRYAIMVANRAREHGSPPFGAVLVSDRGRILLEGENTQGGTSDCTCHAETNLLREATRRFSRAFLKHSALYTSAEPCPMCAGAIFWSGIGRVVFGLSSEHVYALTQNNAEHLFEHCAEVLARGTHRVEVLGPLIEEEAQQVFAQQHGAPSVMSTQPARSPVVGAH
jgi:tRNA(Arg) A34 adenosine deaminase TadA